MRKFSAILFFLIGLIISNSAYAILSMELTRGVSGAVPIAVVPFAVSGSVPPTDVSTIVTNDLQNSGRFKVYGRDSLNTFPSEMADVKFPYFRNLGTDNIVIGKVTPVGGDNYEVSFQLLDAIRSNSAPLLTQKFTVPASELRPLAHHISDLIYQQILGIRGIFSTRLAYIVVQHPGPNARYILEVSDEDGANQHTLLDSPEPIMSPDWAPNGKKLAYVSFENRRASIYVEDVATGSRELVSSYNGINGAPSWSPDGHKLALVLSKDGSPNIYILDLASRRLTQMTHDWSINTEPDWAPDSRAIIFTSNRGGGPQIYKLNVASHAISRVTYDGNYNARASYTPDGNHIVMLHQTSGAFNIGILDLDTGNFRLLTNSANDNESPSMAPNGSMVLYGVQSSNNSVLGMVSSDGTVLLRLPGRDGSVQDPAWSPFLS